MYCEGSTFLCFDFLSSRADLHSVIDLVFPSVSVASFIFVFFENTISPPSAAEGQHPPLKLLETQLKRVTAGTEACRQ